MPGVVHTPLIRGGNLCAACCGCATPAGAVAKSTKPAVQQVQARVKADPFYRDDRAADVIYLSPGGAPDWLQSRK